MQIFATFEHHIYLEIALNKLEEIGITKENIYAVPLNHRSQETPLFDTIHHSDGTTFFDLAMALATAFSVIGVGVGFQLKWGPIYWGLIAAIIGFMLGFIIRLIIEFGFKNKGWTFRKQRHTEVILIIDCPDPNIQTVERLLWDHFALGIAKIET
ncbi:MAG TPA: hypothetical protein VK111_00630 [Virgibacillus sp.]|nr:hypothetical protein [Virgibacillus sp.]